MSLLTSRHSIPSSWTSTAKHECSATGDKDSAPVALRQTAVMRMRAVVFEGRAV